MFDGMLLFMIMAGCAVPAHYLHGALRSRRVRKSLEDWPGTAMGADECSAISGDSLVCRCGSH